MSTPPTGLAGVEGAAEDPVMDDGDPFHEAGVRRLGGYKHSGDACRPRQRSLNSYVLDTGQGKVLHHIKCSG